MNRPLCPDCGGNIYPDTDLDWGSFGQMCCTECGWEDGMRVDPSSLKLPEGHPGNLALSKIERTVLAWIALVNYPFKSISVEIDDACHDLVHKGFAETVIDRGEVCYLIKPVEDSYARLNPLFH